MPKVTSTVPECEPGWYWVIGHDQIDCASFEEWRKLSNDLNEIKRNFYKLYQGKYIKLECYHEVLQAQVEVMEELEITIKDEALVKAVAQEYGTREIPKPMIRLTHATR